MFFSKLHTYCAAISNISLTVNAQKRESCFFRTNIESFFDRRTEEHKGAVFVRNIVCRNSNIFAIRMELEYFQLYSI